MNVLVHIGRYTLFMVKVFSIPDKWKEFWRLLMVEMYQLGVGSVGIVSIISGFMGAVITIQTAAQIESSLVPAYTVGYTTRTTTILEFSPTMLALILAGKIGSNIASQIGTMRVSEQIDALDIMGLNSANYLALPKIIAAILINPFLISISMFLSILMGYVVCATTDLLTTSQYIYGINYDFDPFHLTYAMIKTVVFAFILTSIPAYYGYHTKGGAIQVGESSTHAVVYSSIVILIANYLITQTLLI